MYFNHNSNLSLFQAKAKAAWFILPFIICMICSQGTHAQILIAGTSFDPSPGNGGRTFIGINDIVQYGLQSGSITITPPIAPNVNANTFNATYYYAITDNPYKLDNTRYNDITAAPDYQLVVSPSAATGTNILEYKVSGLAPGTAVQVKIVYCSVVNPLYATCGPGEIVSTKGVINPDAFNGMNGQEGTQVHMGQCTNQTITQTSSNSNAVGANGELTYRLNTQQTGTCKAVGIKSVEIWGTPLPSIYSADGSDVCVGEQITLQSTISYNATYQWQVNIGGAGWNNIAGGTNASQLYEAGASPQTYQFRMVLNPGSASPITSTPITVNAITCCTVAGQPASRQTIFLEDFGKIDLNDKTGKTYLVTDYTNPLAPVQVSKTTATPFRWPITPAPLTATFNGAVGPINDGEYTVAAYLTGYNTPINGYAGAQLQWANRVMGLTTIPNPDLSYDHSGTPEGAALFINCPPSTFGQKLYSRDISNLCSGKQLFFECWIAVFTNSAAGAYNGVNVQVNLTDLSSGTVVTTSGTANRQADGGGTWVKIAAQINMTGNTMRMDIINNENVSVNGNDLVLDDIKIMACAPPSIDLFFDLTTLSQSEAICTNTMDLDTDPSTLLKNYYGGAPKYLMQWSRTPNDYTSWTNIGTPQLAETYTMSNPKTQAPFTGLPAGGKVYFRVVAATAAIFTAKTNFTAPNYANLNDPCKNYSVSAPIEATTDCPLPVDLISFTGQNQNGVNELDWSTASEKNNNYFLIERSLNGTDYEVAGRVEGKGNANSLVAYHFSDAVAGGIIYYRLKQVDNNGAFTYSSPIAIASRVSELSIFPNPNEGSFVISISAPKHSYRLEITDVQGRIVYAASGSSVTETIGLSNFAGGLYIVRLYMDDQVITRKLLVN
ncbi:MAG: T9SS type A sorting domain-containing protein [Cytophagaceae bacterium]